METIQLKVNQRELMKKLNYAFSGREVVLRELMQNARRAGASRVKFVTFQRDGKNHLTVQDNGSGIVDMQRLLDVAESGWNPDLVERETPYGLGFLAALYASESIYVMSRGKWIDVATREILEFAPITVGDASNLADVPGTCITLRGLQATESEIERDLNRAARGFPIPVEFNGDKLDRDDAEDASFRDCSVGRIKLGSYVHRPRVYLQGHPVDGAGDSYSGGAIHLDPRRFVGRFPDRTTLVDQDEARREINQATDQVWREYLAEEKARMTPAAFADAHFDACLHKAPVLLNDVPYVSYDTFSSIEPVISVSRGYDAMPHLERFWGSRLWTREEVEAKALCTLDPFYEIDMDDTYNRAAWTFAAKTEMVYVEQADLARLDSGHWLHALVRHLDQESFDVAIEGEGRLTSYQSPWFSCDVLFCEAYRVTDGNGQSILIGDTALFQEDENRVIYPAQCRNGSVVQQISSFESDERFDEDEMEEAEQQLYCHVIAHRDQSWSTVVEIALREKLGISVQKKKFIVTFDAAGVPVAEEV